ncbi:hypothetical protein I7I53_04685 [Histoplasma capsulatum var. duboisii H88]|uniref:Uncharacterized protein n=1 Tax=Ajellomyces capsulatus (strain H88) TaxID=544711 RepID=A0A8A1LR06_AJEC8|nr:hypothetical protein I7I53_04685 [Histoplasma capsulatum var. duboisii H88]
MTRRLASGSISASIMDSQTISAQDDTGNRQNSRYPDNSPKQYAGCRAYRSQNNVTLPSVTSYQHRLPEDGSVPDKVLEPLSVSSGKMDNLSRPTALNAMPHNSAAESLKPHLNPRASAPPLLPEQALKLAGSGALQENSRPTTFSPLGEVGCAGHAARPGLLDASYTKLQGSPRPDVSSFESTGGRGTFAPVTPILLPPWPQPTTSRNHKAVVEMFGSSSIDGRSCSPVESGEMTELESADDVMTAAAAAAIEQPQSQKFENLDVDSVGLNEAVFYFGVLAVVANLRPSFSYARTAGGNWRAFLTYWGATVSRDGAYEDKFLAKAETCRSALEGLKEKYSGWTLPELPGPQVLLGGWIWTTLLQEYCEQNKLARPVYTKYAHHDGCRYEVDVGGISCFGANKFYKTATEAIHASAHAALYSLLITSLEVTPLFRGVGFAGSLLTNSVNNNNNETATAPVQKPSLQPQITQVKRKRHAGKNKILSGDPDLPAGRSNVSTMSGSDLLPPGPSKQVGKKAKKKAKRENANLLPIPTRSQRLPTAEVTASRTKNEKISSRDLRLVTSQYWNPCQRVEKICSLLSIDQPEYHMTELQVDGPATWFSATARFPNDPFLARVGSIGRSKFIYSMQIAKEKCAAQVVDYLIKMVKEDEEWADPKEQTQENIRKWEQMAATAAVSVGVSELGVTVDSHAARGALGKYPGVDPFGSDAMYDFIPLEECVKIEKGEEE